MALSKDDILNAIAEMSVMDIVELIEAMEEKFGVSAAAAVAAAPVAAAGGDAGAAADRLQPGHRSDSLRDRHGLRPGHRLPDAAAGREPVHRLGDLEHIERRDIAAGAALRGDQHRRDFRDCLRAADLALAAQALGLLTGLGARRERAPTTHEGIRKRRHAS